MSNVALGHGKLTLFDSWGLLSEKGSWIVESPLTGFAYEQNPAPIKNRIEKAIQQDVAAGREHLISFVGMYQFAGIQLWLEGVITRKHVENCTEGTDPLGAYVMFDKVALGGKRRTIKVYQDPPKQYDFATFDVNFDVV